MSKDIIFNSLRSKLFSNVKDIALWKKFMQTLSVEMEYKENEGNKIKDIYDVEVQDIDGLSNIADTFGYTPNRVTDDSKEFLKKEVESIPIKIKKKTTYDGYDILFSQLGEFGDVYNFYYDTQKLVRALKIKDLISYLNSYKEGDVPNGVTPYKNFVLVTSNDPIHLDYKENNIVVYDDYGLRIYSLDMENEWLLDVNKSICPTKHLGLEYYPSHAYITQKHYDVLNTESSLTYSVILDNIDKYIENSFKIKINNKFINLTFDKSSESSHFEYFTDNDILSSDKDNLSNLDMSNGKLTLVFNSEQIDTEIQLYWNQGYLYAPNFYNYFENGAKYTKRVPIVPHVGVQVNGITRVGKGVCGDGEYTVKDLQLKSTTTPIFDKIYDDTNGGIKLTTGDEKNTAYIVCGNGKKTIPNSKYTNLFNQNNFVFYYTFDDEDTNNIIEDSSANKNSAKVYGSSKKVPSCVGKSVDFNGSSYVKSNSNISFNFSKDFTLSFWICADSTTANSLPFYILSLGDFKVWYSYYKEELHVILGTNESIIDLSKNEIHNVMIENKSSVCKIYIDGKSKSNLTNSLTTISDNFYFGANKELTSFFKGKLDSVFLSEKTFSSAEKTYIVENKLSFVSHLGNKIATYRLSKNEKNEDKDWYITQSYVKANDITNEYQFTPDMNIISYSGKTNFAPIKNKYFSFDAIVNDKIITIKADDKGNFYRTDNDEYLSGGIDYESGEYSFVTEHPSYVTQEVVQSPTTKTTPLYGYRLATSPIESWYWDFELQEKCVADYIQSRDEQGIEPNLLVTMYYAKDPSGAYLPINEEVVPIYSEDGNAFYLDRKLTSPVTPYLVDGDVTETVLYSQNKQTYYLKISCSGDTVTQASVTGEDSGTYVFVKNYSSIMDNIFYKDVPCTKEIYSFKIANTDTAIFSEQKPIYYRDLIFKNSFDADHEILNPLYSFMIKSPTLYSDDNVNFYTDMNRTYGYEIFKTAMKYVLNCYRIKGTTRLVYTYDNNTYFEEQDCLTETTISETDVLELVKCYDTILDNPFLYKKKGIFYNNFNFNKKYNPQADDIVKQVYVYSLNNDSIIYRKDDTYYSDAKCTTEYQLLDTDTTSLISEYHCETPSVWSNNASNFYTDDKLTKSYAIKDGVSYSMVYSYLDNDTNKLIYTIDGIKFYSDLECTSEVTVSGNMTKVGIYKLNNPTVYKLNSKYYTNLELKNEFNVQTNDTVRSVTCYRVNDTSTVVYRKVDDSNYYTNLNFSETYNVKDTDNFYQVYTYFITTPSLFTFDDGSYYTNLNMTNVYEKQDTDTEKTVKCYVISGTTRVVYEKDGNYYADINCTEEYIIQKGMTLSNVGYFKIYAPILYSKNTTDFYIDMYMQKEYELQLGDSKTRIDCYVLNNNNQILYKRNGESTYYTDVECTNVFVTTESTTPIYVYEIIAPCVYTKNNNDFFTDTKLTNNYSIQKGDVSEKIYHYSVNDNGNVITIYSKNRSDFFTDTRCKNRYNVTGKTIEEYGIFEIKAPNVFTVNSEKYFIDNTLLSKYVMQSANTTTQIYCYNIDSTSTFLYRKEGSSDYYDSLDFNNRYYLSGTERLVEIYTYILKAPILYSITNNQYYTDTTLNNSYEPNAIAKKSMKQVHCYYVNDTKEIVYKKDDDNNYYIDTDCEEKYDKIVSSITQIEYNKTTTPKVIYSKDNAEFYTDIQFANKYNTSNRQITPIHVWNIEGTNKTIYSLGVESTYYINLNFDEIYYKSETEVLNEIQYQDLTTPALFKNDSNEYFTDEELTSPYSIQIQQTPQSVSMFYDTDSKKIVYSKNGTDYYSDPKCTIKLLSTNLGKVDIKKISTPNLFSFNGKRYTDLNLSSQYTVQNGTSEEVVEEYVYNGTNYFKKDGSYYSDASCKNKTEVPSNIKLVKIYKPTVTRKVFSTNGSYFYKTYNVRELTGTYLNSDSTKQKITMYRDSNNTLFYGLNGKYYSDETCTTSYSPSSTDTVVQHACIYYLTSNATYGDYDKDDGGFVGIGEHTDKHYYKESNASYSEINGYYSNNRWFTENWEDITDKVVFKMIDTNRTPYFKINKYTVTDLSYVNLDDSVTDTDCWYNQNMPTPSGIKEVEYDFTSPKYTPIDGYNNGVTFAFDCYINSIADTFRIFVSNNNTYKNEICTSSYTEGDGDTKTEITRSVIDLVQIYYYKSKIYSDRTMTNVFTVQSADVLGTSVNVYNINDAKLYLCKKVYYSDLSLEHVYNVQSLDSIHTIFLNNTTPPNLIYKKDNIYYTSLDFSTVYDLQTYNGDTVSVMSIYKIIGNGKGQILYTKDKNNYYTTLEFLESDKYAVNKNDFVSQISCYAINTPTVYKKSSSSDYYSDSKFSTKYTIQSDLGDKVSELFAYDIITPFIYKKGEEYFNSIDLNVSFEVQSSDVIEQINTYKIKTPTMIYMAENKCYSDLEFTKPFNIQDEDSMKEVFIRYLQAPNLYTLNNSTFFSDINLSNTYNLTSLDKKTSIDYFYIQTPRLYKKNNNSTYYSDKDLSEEYKIQSIITHTSINSFVVDDFVLYMKDNIYYDSLDLLNIYNVQEKDTLTDFLLYSIKTPFVYTINDVDYFSNPACTKSYTLQEGENIKRVTFYRTRNPIVYSIDRETYFTDTNLTIPFLLQSGDIHYLVYRYSLNNSSMILYRYEDDNRYYNSTTFETEYKLLPSDTLDYIRMFEQKEDKAVLYLRQSDIPTLYHNLLFTAPYELTEEESILYTYCALSPHTMSVSSTSFDTEEIAYYSTYKEVRTVTYVHNIVNVNLKNLDIDPTTLYITYTDYFGQKFKTWCKYDEQTESYYFRGTAIESSSFNVEHSTISVKFSGTGSVSDVLAFYTWTSTFHMDSKKPIEFNYKVDYNMEITEIGIENENHELYGYMTFPPIKFNSIDDYISAIFAWQKRYK